MEGTFCVLLPCQVNSSLWSDGTPDAVSHSFGQVSGAADQDVEDSFSLLTNFNEFIDEFK